MIKISLKKRLKLILVLPSTLCLVSFYNTIDRYICYGFCKPVLLVYVLFFMEQIFSCNIASPKLLLQESPHQQYCQFPQGHCPLHCNGQTLLFPSGLKPIHFFCWRTIIFEYSIYGDIFHFFIFLCVQILGTI